MRAIENYPVSVLEDAQDVLLKTAFARGCVDKDGFSKFFDSIISAPKKIGTEEIEMLDDQEIEDAIQSGHKDIKKQQAIGAEWKSQRHCEKPKHSLKHDAALDCVLELLRRRSVKSWVITADGPMQTLATKWAGSAPPTWIGVDTLIQILAIFSGGPSHRPENFAPLFGTIIREDIHYSDSTFTLEDLDALLDLEERVKELNNDEIEQFASKMRRLRMAGKSKDDSELQLEIRRTFQRKKISGDENTKNLERRVEEISKDLKKETGHGIATRAALVDQIFRMEKIKKIVGWLLKGVLVLIIGLLLAYHGFKNVQRKNDALGYFLITLAFGEFLLPLFLWIMPGYKKAREEARILAEKKATDAVKIKF